jgi:hypothetical protein
MSAVYELGSSALLLHGITHLTHDLYVCVVCVCVCVYIYIHIYIYMTCVYIYVYMRVCMYTSLYFPDSLSPYIHNSVYTHVLTYT